MFQFTHKSPLILIATRPALVGCLALFSLVSCDDSSSSSSGESSYDTSRQSTDYTPRYSQPAAPPKPVFTEPEQPLPSHGKVVRYTRSEPKAPLAIRSSIESNYLVKLCDYYSGKDVLSIFVHGGIDIELDVPLGTYTIKYASGTRWYGDTHLFGPETGYSKADSSFDFRIIGNQISGYTLTLYKVINGNLPTSSISPDDF